MAPVSGIEPETTESKSVVLPVTPHRNKNITGYLFRRLYRLCSTTERSTHEAWSWNRTNVSLDFAASILKITE
jgi:hypothetical protein